MKCACKKYNCGRHFTYCPMSDDYSPETEDKSVEWDDEGLPPVGTVCEMQDETGNWVQVKILGGGNGYTVGWCCSRLVPYYSDKKEEFRPIKSDKEKAIEEMQSVLGNAGLDGEASYDALSVFYDAGYKK